MSEGTGKGASLEPCTLADCPPGLFRGQSGHLGLKTEYSMVLGRSNSDGTVSWKMTNWPEAFVVESGEVWWGGASNYHERAAQIVTPLSVDALTPPTEPPSAGREGWKPERCPNCAFGRSFAQVDELKADGHYGPGPQWRCVECKAVIDPPAAPPPEPQPSVRLDREEIARIICPYAFIVSERAADAEATKPWKDVLRKDALAKADAIISSARSGGDG